MLFKQGFAHNMFVLDNKKLYATIYLFAFKARMLQKKLKSQKLCHLSINFDLHDNLFRNTSV